uniref:Uncharacterized protein n=1 Tax=Lepeophtheirus salmonis TaxID=72036 RepID=A0A0K2TR48_LEPSM
MSPAVRTRVPFFHSSIMGPRLSTSQGNMIVSPMRALNT